MPRGTTSQGRRRSRSPAQNDGADTQGRRAAPAGQQDFANLQLADPLKTCRHLYLQSLISRRVVPKELAERLYKDCVKVCNVEDAPAIADFIASIEAGLNLIGFELKQTKDQETGQTVYILANSVQDTSAKLATDYKPEEIGFFKAIVGKIMHARDMSYCVTQTEAVKAAKAPITPTRGIQLVKSFLARDWLALHPASGRLILSARSLFELAPYLRETFADEDDEDVEPRERVVVYCNYCSKMVTSGYACANRHCGIRLHTYCANVQIGGKSGRCPDYISNSQDPCTRVWTQDPATKRFNAQPVGVEALGLDSNAADPTSHASSDDEGPVTDKKKKKGGAAAKAKPKAKGKGKKKQASDDEDEEMDDDEDDDEDDEDEDDGEGAGTPTQSSARKSSRRTSTSAGKRHVIQPDSDEEDEEEE